MANDKIVQPELNQNLKNTPETGPVLDANSKERQPGSKETTDVLTTPPSGELQKLYLAKMEALKEKETNDIATLTKSVESVRYDVSLLEGKENTDKIKSIKAETARRINAYTTGVSDDWYTLNYSKVGTDEAGHSHETFIGLGDILLDPSIKEILIEKEGKIIHAVRGTVTSGKHRGRVGFVDKSNQEYVATHDNDKFKILSDVEIDKTESDEAFLKLLEGETNVRLEHQKNFKQEVKDEQTENLSLTEASVESSSDILNQIKISLSGEQKANAEIIIQEFSKYNLPPNLIAAAIVNAYKESGIKNNNPGDHGHSHGLFQLNDVLGAGIGMTPAEMQDPHINAQTILRKEVMAGRGAHLRARAKAGASINELSFIFCRDIERPGKNWERRIFRSRERAKFALTMFPTKMKEELPNRFRTAEGHKAKNTLVAGKPAMFGSSTAYGMESEVKNVLGIESSNAGQFLSKLEKWWPLIEKNKPSRVTIVGLAANGLTPDSSKLEQNVAKNLREYDALVDFLHSKGITDVRIATIQPVGAKIEAINAFNKALRSSKHKDNLIDLAAEITTADGKSFKEGMDAGDNMHLSQKAKSILRDLHERA